MERKSNIRHMGASVRGPQHKRENKPNQDAWIRISRAWGNLVAVCDGVGSRPQSRDGARKACTAVLQACKLYENAISKDPYFLIASIEQKWLELINNSPENYASTCSFAYLLNNNTYILANLGDCLALISQKGGQVRKVTEGRLGFTNETLGLGIPHELKDWQVFVGNNLEVNEAIFLASDGIGDDLRPDKYCDFINFLIMEYGNMKHRQRTKLLHYQLNNWPTPNHLDDKTFVLMWRNDDQILG